LDNPIIKIIEENSSQSPDKTNQLDNEENKDPISVMSLVANKLWCGIRDRIFVVCPNSLDVQVKNLFIMKNKSNKNLV
jgi:hypothetical protein